MRELMKPEDWAPAEITYRKQYAREVPLTPSLIPDNQIRFLFNNMERPVNIIVENDPDAANGNSNGNNSECRAESVHASPVKEDSKENKITSFLEKLAPRIKRNDKKCSSTSDIHSESSMDPQTYSSQSQLDSFQVQVPDSHRDSKKRSRSWFHLPSRGSFRNVSKDHTKEDSQTSKV